MDHCVVGRGWLRPAGRRQINRLYHPDMAGSKLEVERQTTVLEVSRTMGSRRGPIPFECGFGAEP